MSSQSNGSFGGNAGNGPSGQRLNIFALVIYIPDTLGRFLDDLRRDLVPQYKPRAHVSVLPPRPLTVDWRLASEELRGVVETWSPFEIDLTRIEIFPATNVIYLEIGEGAGELRKMHTAMTCHCLAFEEPFSYHPHVTLAQEIPPSAVDDLRNHAERRWREYRGPRRFRAERAMFVQSATNNHWIDLAEYALGVAAVR